MRTLFYVYNSFFSSSNVSASRSRRASKLFFLRIFGVNGTLQLGHLIGPSDAVVGLLFQQLNMQCFSFDFYWCRLHTHDSGVKELLVILDCQVEKGI